MRNKKAIATGKSFFFKKNKNKKNLPLTNNRLITNNINLFIVHKIYKTLIYPITIQNS